MDPDPSNDPSNEGLDIGINRAVSDVDLISAVARNSDRLQQNFASQPSAPSLSTDARTEMDAFNSQVQSLAMNPSAPPHPAMSQPQTPYEYQRPIQFSGEHFSNPLSAHPQIAYSPYLPHTSMYQHHPPYIHLSSAHMPNYGYPPQPYYENPQTGDFSVETMHGMPGYPGRPPIPRSSHTSPLNPSPPYPHYPSSQPHSRPSTAQTQAYGGMWGSPPMSPVLEPMQYGSIGSLATMGRDDRLRHPSQVDEFGGMQGGRSMFYPTGPLASWNAPSVSSPYAFYSPYQQQAPTMAMRSGQEPWSTDTSPALAQGAFASRGSWTGQPPPSNSQLNRMSWSGPSRPTVRTSAESPDREKERERKAYHPQPPARRSDWVMWVGNVPNNTSHEELWRYFNTTIPSLDPSIEAEPWRGPSSIFLISRSSCAFVNLSSQADLERAVGFFNGRPLRQWDPRCPRMVCRIRRKDDDLRAGVGAQRGTGMHREWVKSQPGEPPIGPSVGPPQTPGGSTTNGSVPPSPAILEHPPEGEGRRRESILVGQNTVRQTSASHASTNSSFLTKHFPKRIFILKSLTTAELEDSARSGTWRTQRHNEPILDQAFRTSGEGVFLIFGANRSGEFFGYAKMIEPIDKGKSAISSANPGSASSKHTSRGSSSGSASQGQTPSRHKSQPVPAQIKEEDGEDDRVRSNSKPNKPTYFLSPSQSYLASSSPSELSPSEEVKGVAAAARGQRNTDPTRPTAQLLNNKGTSLTITTQRAQTLDPKAGASYFPPVPIAATSASPGPETEKQQILGGSTRQPELGEDGVLRKDTVLSPDEKEERKQEHRDELEEPQEFSPEGWGQSFNIQWIKVGSLPFGRTRHLRNPWNADREVKVSRDGTEVEPTVGSQIMAEWDKLMVERSARSVPSSILPSPTRRP